MEALCQLYAWHGLKNIRDRGPHEVRGQKLPLEGV